MKIAIISDIHGNLHALLAVLADAERAGAERFVFLGDYYLDMPFPNEVADAIRRPDAIAVRGNKEDYMRGLNPDKNTWTVAQMASLYWNHERLTEENARFFADLPIEAGFHADGGFVRAFHMPGHVFKGTSVMLMSSRNYYRNMKEQPFNRSYYQGRADYILTGDYKLSALLDGLPDGAYLFGHTHIQWHWHGKGKLLLNPGSCGMALDFDNTAAYSIIKRKNNKWLAEERRVPYDISRAVESLRASGLYKAAPHWSDIITEHLELAEDHVTILIETAEKIAAEAGEYGQPFSNNVWHKACDVYKASGIAEL
ncbi:MAG: metallophosphoesterase family protein [Defluviitaleaceae bacterium]|nr:metallophosphoesterase family protein [Defluviitaleaceae bacterium]